MNATLHLQGIGLCSAIRAEELKAGDILSCSMYSGPEAFSNQSGNF